MTNSLNRVLPPSCLRMRIKDNGKHQTTHLHPPQLFLLPSIH